MALFQTGVCRFCSLAKFHRKSLVFLNICNIRHTHKYTQVAPKKPTKYKAVYRDLHGVLTDNQAAKDFVFALEPGERNLLLAELQKFYANGAELLDSGAETKPTSQQLRLVCLHNTLPYIGFGFLDNCVMLLAGEYIEFKFGVALGISTMAAAALGNWVSDLAGVGTVHYVEVLTSKFGVKAPALTPKQVDMRQTRWASNVGKAIGISIGCVLGMFPLLFYDTKSETEDTSKKTDSDKNQTS